MFRQAGELTVPSHAMTIVLQIVHLYNLFLEKRLQMRNLMDLFYVLRFGDGRSKQFQFSQNTIDGEIKELGLTRFSQGTMWLMKEIFNLDTNHMPVEPLEEEGQYILSEMMGDGFTFHNWWHKHWYYTWQNLT